MPFASVLDVEARHGSALSNEGQVLEWLDDAEDDLRTEFRAVGRDLHGEVTSGRLGIGTVQRVECELVLLRLANPFGAASASTQETVGPFSRQQSTTYGSGAGGRFELTDHHRRLLGLPSRGSFTIRPAGHGPRAGWRG